MEPSASTKTRDLSVNASKVSLEKLVLKVSWFFITESHPFSSHIFMPLVSAFTELELTDMKLWVTPLDFTKKQKCR